MVYNSSEVEKNVMAQFSEALKIVLEKGFGKIEAVIDEKRGVYRVRIKNLPMKR